MTIAAHSAAPTAGETRWQPPCFHTGTCVSFRYQIMIVQECPQNKQALCRLLTGNTSLSIVCQLTGFEGTYGLHLSKGVADRKHQVHFAHTLQDFRGIFCRPLSKLNTGTASCDVSIIIASYSALILTPPMEDKFSGCVFCLSYWYFRPVLVLAFWPPFYFLSVSGLAYLRVFCLSPRAFLFFPSPLPCLCTSGRCCTN